MDVLRAFVEGWESENSDARVFVADPNATEYGRLFCLVDTVMRKAVPSELEKVGLRELAGRFRKLPEIIGDKGWNEADALLSEADDATAEVPEEKGGLEAWSVVHDARHLLDASHFASWEEGRLFPIVTAYAAALAGRIVYRTGLDRDKIIRAFVKIR